MNKLLETMAEIIEVVFLIALIIILLPIWLPVTLISNHTTNKWLEKQKYKSE
jgi:antibiotic biosynthesis monooxygenase (ABM) superfamily enzyme